MAIYPRGSWRPLPQNTTEPTITPTQVILHTAVSTASSLWDYFAHHAPGTESHFYVAGNGAVEQYMDTTRQADAQWDGNLHGVSIETWDNARPATTPWTPAQLASIIDLVAWLCDVHRIPPRLCPGPQSPGVGYHQLFAEWNQNHHDCPGPARRVQTRTVIDTVAGPAPSPQPRPTVEAGMVRLFTDVNGVVWLCNWATMRRVALGPLQLRDLLTAGVPAPTVVDQLTLDLFTV